jgi:hypothetical protein
MSIQFIYDPATNVFWNLSTGEIFYNNCNYFSVLNTTIRVFNEGGAIASGSLSSLLYIQAAVMAFLVALLWCGWAAREYRDAQAGMKGQKG